MAQPAETAFFLAEVAGRHGYAGWRRRIDEATVTTTPPCRGRVPNEKGAKQYSLIFAPDSN